MIEPDTPNGRRRFNREFAIDLLEHDLALYSYVEEALDEDIVEGVA